MHFVQVEKKSHEVEDLMKKCNYKTRMSSTPSRFVKSISVSIYQPLSFPATTFATTKNADYGSIDKKSDYLTEIMKDVAIFCLNSTKLYSSFREKKYLISTSTYFFNQLFLMKSLRSFISI